MDLLYFLIYRCQNLGEPQHKPLKDVAEAQEGSHFRLCCLVLQFASCFCRCFRNFQPSGPCEVAQIVAYLRKEGALFNSCVTPALCSSVSSSRSSVRLSWTVSEKTKMSCAYISANCHFTDDNMTSISFSKKAEASFRADDIRTNWCRAW